MIKDMTIERKIIHLDMDAFYASVEQRENPELKGKPVIVGGNPNSRGVVCTASYEARKFGVRSAMPCKTAYKLCPQAFFVRPNFSLYKAASEIIRGIFHEVTDLVEPLSLDEAYLDVTKNYLKLKSATKVAKYIQEEIFKRTKLTSSAGVASNKFIAKVASDFKKPNGLTIIPPEKVDSFLKDLPIEKLFGVGPATASKLKKSGIHVAGQIREKDREYLYRLLGKFGPVLFNLSHGIDPRPVEIHHERKGHSAERTYSEDQFEKEVLLKTLTEISQRLSKELQAKYCKAKTISLKLRYSDFETITRNKTLSFYTNEEKQIFHWAKSLLENSWNIERSIRLIGISVTGLQNPDDSYQLDLFSSKEVFIESSTFN